LQLSPLFEEAGALLRLARERGVDGCLVPSYGPKEWSRQDELNEFDGVYQALGIHPWCVPGCDLESLVSQLNDAFDFYPGKWKERLKAVGEFGLDKSRSEFKECFEVQKTLFRLHREWAQRLSLPVILHVVKAHGAACDLLRESSTSITGVIHAFAGPKELVAQYAEFDLCFSYGGSLKYSEKAKEALRSTPREKMMFETDGPDGPNLVEDEPLSPALLPKVVETAADVLGTTKEWCWTVHRENCRRVFGL